MRVLVLPIIGNETMNKYFYPPLKTYKWFKKGIMSPKSTHIKTYSLVALIENGSTHREGSY